MMTSYPSIGMSSTPKPIPCQSFLRRTLALGRNLWAQIDMTEKNREGIPICFLFCFFFWTLFLNMLCSIGRIKQPLSYVFFPCPMVLSTNCRTPPRFSRSRLESRDGSLSYCKGVSKYSTPQLRSPRATTTLSPSIPQPLLQLPRWGYGTSCLQISRAKGWWTASCRSLSRTILLVKNLSISWSCAKTSVLHASVPCVILTTTSGSPEA